MRKKRKEAKERKADMAEEEAGTILDAQDTIDSD